MKTTLLPGLLGTFLLGVSGIVTLNGPSFAEAGDSSWSCVPELSQEPAAGSWHGSHRFEYKMIVPGTPQAYAIEWTGDDDLELRENAEERDRRSTCSRGFVGTTPTFALPPEPGCNVDGTPVPWLSRYDEKPPELRGHGTVVMHMELQSSDPGFGLSHGAASQTPAEFPTEAERDPTGKRLEAIALQGTPDQFRFGAALTARDESGVTSMHGQLSGAGTASASGTLQGDEATGTVEATVAGGREQTHVDITDRDGERKTGDSGAAVHTLSQQRRTMFRLVVEKRECGEIGGTVESKELIDQIRDAGMGFEPVRSEWHATLDQRDEAFEQSVKRYAEEPILRMDPRDPESTWTSWQREWELYASLRGHDPTDYELCVLRPAHEKIIKASTLALRALLDAGAARSDVGKLRMWRMMSTIEGFGRGTYVGCPVIREATEALFGVRPPLPPPPPG